MCARTHTHFNIAGLALASNLANIYQHLKQVFLMPDDFPDLALCCRPLCRSEAPFAVSKSHGNMLCLEQALREVRRHSFDTTSRLCFHACVFVAAVVHVQLQEFISRQLDRYT
mmetsp:Transcript_52266/g.168339  ORF Transcript_52266/g.168339 Transcript_52266/m.168339 type:complete len:113 (-) Transcript_52266:283-621(-)